ncbi:MAG TPA: hypothetical protein VK061_08955 [Bacillota bacterium]|nr:hypothetical protein [Bacillota bacterium]
MAVLGVLLELSKSLIPIIFMFAQMIAPLVSLANNSVYSAPSYSYILASTVFLLGIALLFIKK